MNRGYYKTWRKALDSGWLKNHKLWVFWSYCLMRAAYKEHDAIVGYQTVHLLPGQFIFGRKKAAEELNLTERSIRTNLDFLVKSQNVTIETTNKFSIITIVNWNIYQCDERDNDQQTDQQLANNRPATDQPLTTYKKEEKGKKRSSTLPDLFFEFETRAWNGISDKDKDGWKAAYPACDIEIELAGMAEWLLSNPDKKKSNYRRFITNWLKKAQDKGGSKRAETTRKTFTEIEEERAHRWRVEHGLV